MPNGKINPEQAYQTFLVIWFALLISQLLFPFIVFFVKPELFVFDFTKLVLDDNGAVLLLIAGSIVIFIVSVNLRRNYLRLALERQNVWLIQTATIIGCAMSEMISLIGLFLAFAYDYQYFFLFSAAGIAATLFHFPRRAYVHEAGTRSIRRPF